MRFSISMLTSQLTLSFCKSYLVDHIFKFIHFTYQPHFPCAPTIPFALPHHLQHNSSPMDSSEKGSASHGASTRSGISGRGWTKPLSMHQIWARHPTIENRFQKASSTGTDHGLMSGTPQTDQIFSDILRIPFSISLPSLFQVKYYFPSQFFPFVALCPTVHLSWTLSFISPNGIILVSWFLWWLEAVYSHLKIQTRDNKSDRTCDFLLSGRGLPHSV